jgi:hypothetical protein
MTKTEVGLELNRANYVLLVANLAAGLLVGFYNVRAALIPAAVVFGWSQIGGL